MKQRNVSNLTASVAQEIDQLEAHFKEDLKSLQEMTEALVNKKKIENELDGIYSDFLEAIKSYYTVVAKE